MQTGYLEWLRPGQQEKNKTKQKQQLLQTSLPERVKGKRLGEMAKSLLSLPTVDFEYNNVIRLCHLHLALHF